MQTSSEGKDSAGKALTATTHYALLSIWEKMVKKSSIPSEVLGNTDFMKKVRKKEPKKKDRRTRDKNKKNYLIPTLTSFYSMKR